MLLPNEQPLPWHFSAKANAGAAMTSFFAAIIAATKSAKNMRLNVLPVALIVSCCPIVFLLLVEGAGLGLTLASARLLVTVKPYGAGRGGASAELPIRGTHSQTTGNGYPY